MSRRGPLKKEKGRFAGVETHEGANIHERFMRAKGIVEVV